MCLACGYNLYGLGEELRCPECGLINLPDGIRKQTWEFVDTRSWFFSSMFSPFKKRPAGWWWALDREGDVHRSVRILIRNLVLTVVIIVTGMCLNNIFVVIETTHYASYPSGNTKAAPLYEATWERPFGFMGIPTSPWSAEDQPDWSKLYTQNSTVVEKKDVTVQYMFNWQYILRGGGFSLWCILIWAVPALVGIFTQIRRGLPDFARAPRTITTAANYESHRLIYLSLLVLIFLAVEVVVRWYTILAGRHSLFRLATMSILGLLTFFGACGWVGPFRSDYTKQLIRSRFHGFRMIVMYAVLLPIFITGAFYELIDKYILGHKY